MIKEKLIADLEKALKKLGIKGILPTLEHPLLEEHGDYSSNIAIVVFRQLNYKTPLELAQKIASLILKDKSAKNYLAKVEVAKPGFINFWLNKVFLKKELKEVLKQKDNYGKSTPGGKRKKLMVEFAHPNTHKLFHIGHLRNISTGEAIVRILKANGTEVIRANYQGDVGLHIAKCLWGIKKLFPKLTDNEQISGEQISVSLGLDTLNKKIDFLGKAYVGGVKAYETDQKAKEEIEQINKQIYQKDSKIIKIWQETRSWSLEYFERIYQRVDSHFDRYYFESEVAELGKREVLDGLKKGIFEESQKAVIFPGKKFGLHNRVFINQTGLPTYEAKDIGLAKLQFEEFSPDLIIHVVGPEQKGYFEVVFKALEELFPKTKGREFHLVYGWVRLKTGKMSSRTGEVVLAEWLLEEIKKRLKEKYQINEEEKAEALALSAAKYSMLKISPSQELIFDIDESINLEGDSGPYLLYTYARCQSVLNKADQNLDFSLDYDNFNQEEIALMRIIYKFPEIIVDAGRLYSPNLICAFLFNLAKKYNLFYNKWSILKAEDQKTRSFRLALSAATAQVLKNGLYLLGIKVLERV